MEVAPATQAKDAAILIGDTKESPLTQSTLVAMKHSHEAKSSGAQGYVLAGDDKRIVISGGDAQGAFYGTQALLSLTRRNAAGNFFQAEDGIRDLTVTGVQTCALPI